MRTRSRRAASIQSSHWPSNPMLSVLNDFLLRQFVLSPIRPMRAMIVQPAEVTFDGTEQLVRCTVDRLVHGWCVTGDSNRLAAFEARLHHTALVPSLRSYP